MTVYPLTPSFVPRLRYERQSICFFPLSSSKTHDLFSTNYILLPNQPTTRSISTTNHRFYSQPGHPNYLSPNLPITRSVSTTNHQIHPQSSLPTPLHHPPPLQPRPNPPSLNPINSITHTTTLHTYQPLAHHQCATPNSPSTTAGTPCALLAIIWTQSPNHRGRHCL